MCPSSAVHHLQSYPLHRFEKTLGFPQYDNAYFFPPEGTYSGRGMTIFLYSLSKIFFRNAVKHDYKRLFPIWQILMIARCGEFVTSYVKTELAITSATVQRGISWSTSSAVKLILLVSKLKTLVFLNSKLLMTILFPQQMTKEMSALMQMARFYYHKSGVAPAVGRIGQH